MSKDNKTLPGPTGDRIIKEGFGALYYHYFANQPPAPGSPGTISIPSPRPSVGANTPVDTKENRMSWQQNRERDVHAMVRKFQGGRNLSGFTKNDHVIAIGAIPLAEATIPKGAKGVITGYTKDSYVVEFVSLGEHVISASDAAYNLSYDSYVKEDPLKSMVRRVFKMQETTEGNKDDLSIPAGLELVNPTQETLKAGDHATDSTGDHLCIEGVEADGNVKAMDSTGAFRIVPASEIVRLSKETPLPVVEGFDGDPITRFDKIQVVRVDPVLNSRRSHGIEPGVAEAMIGKIGQVEFAYYPIDGLRMYSILFDNYGRRDFSDSEIAPVTVAGTASSEQPAA